MVIRKLRGAAAVLAVLALSACQTNDNSSARPATGATPQTANAPGGQAAIRHVSFRQQPGGSARMRPVAARSTLVSAQGGIIIARAPVAGSGWQSMRIVVVGTLRATFDESFVTPQMLARARAVGTDVAEVFRALNDIRANDSENAAAEFALALISAERVAPALNWLFDAALQDGGAYNAILLADMLRGSTMSALQSTSRTLSPGERTVLEDTLDLAAGMLVYGATVAIVDGHKCADATAAERRPNNLLAPRTNFLNEIRAFPAERRAKIRRFAAALELATAAERVPDPSICRAGVEETRLAVADSWAGGLPLSSPELVRRGRREADGTLYVVVPAAAERPSMYRARSEFPEALERGRARAREFIDPLVPTGGIPAT